MKDFDTHKFITTLERLSINYYYEGKWLIIDNRWDVYLNSENFTLLPNHIRFNSGNDVYLSNNQLTSLSNIEFNNKGFVMLHGNNLTSLPDNIKFNNGGVIDLSNNKLISLPDNIKFNNDDKIYLYNNPLTSLPNNIDEFYDRLDNLTKEYISKTFPEHQWLYDKERFNL